MVGAKVICLFAFLAVAFCSKKIERRSFSVDLNDFFDANFKFGQKIIPINQIVDGTLLFPEIQSENGTFTNVYMHSLEPLKRLNDFVQLVEIDTMRNTIRGAIGSDKIVLRVGSIASEQYLGPTTLKNMEVHINKPFLNIETIMSPTSEKTCVFDSNIQLLTNGAITLRSNYPFYNNSDISAFFRETFQGFVNNEIIKGKGKDIPIPGHCDPVLYLKDTLTSLF